MFIDEADIYVQAGTGGNGCRSFRHARDVKKRKPNGGNGGRGGHVVIKADSNIHTLKEFNFKKNIKAPKGSNGGSNNKTGSDGKDIYLLVPLGTIISNQDNNLTIRDLKEDGEEVLVARGGRGGRGNGNASDAQAGRPGEAFRLHFDLKLIADVGLIGYPNAGKSSLISCLSKAKPKVAAYPFTTKSPVLGIVEYEEEEFKIADIPGLIEGAHQGSGLGDRFLRHIERTKALVFVIDLAGTDGRNPWDDFFSLKNELMLYNKELLKKRYTVLVNKVDLQEAKSNLLEFKSRVKESFVEISCKEGINLDKALAKISGLLR
jgi:GTP-binding protein